MSAHTLPGELAPQDVPRRGVLGTIQLGVDGLNHVAALGAGLALATASLVLTWEVIGRYFLSAASDWQDELSTFLLIGATFTSAAWIQARRGHVAIDALGHVLPPRIDRVRRVLADAVSLAFVSFFAWKSVTLLMEAIEDDQTTSSSWGPPLWIPYACMAGGMILLAVQIALQLFSSRHLDSRPDHL